MVRWWVCVRGGMGFLLMMGWLGDTGLFRIHALPRHLPRRTRQNGADDRSRLAPSSSLLLPLSPLSSSPPSPTNHLPHRLPPSPTNHHRPPPPPPPHFHNLRPRARHPLRAAQLPLRIPPLHHRPHGQLGADQRRVQEIPCLFQYAGGGDGGDGLFGGS